MELTILQSSIVDSLLETVVCTVHLVVLNLVKPDAAMSSSSTSVLDLICPSMVSRFGENLAISAWCRSLPLIIFCSYLLHLSR